MPLWALFLFAQWQLEVTADGLHAVSVSPEQTECLSADAFVSAIQTDIDRSGEIEYGEFLAATLHLSKIEKQENLLKAFQYFDADGSGAITLDELQKACEEMQLSKTEIEGMMKEIDKNNVRGGGRGGLSAFCGCAEGQGMAIWGAMPQTTTLKV